MNIHYNLNNLHTTISKPICLYIFTPMFLFSRIYINRNTHIHYISAFYLISQMQLNNNITYAFENQIFEFAFALRCIQLIIKYTVIT